MTRLTDSDTNMGAGVLSGRYRVSNWLSEAQSVRSLHWLARSHSQAHGWKMKRTGVVKFICFIFLIDNIETDSQSTHQIISL